MKNIFVVTKNRHKIKEYVTNTWTCWDPGEEESKVTNHGWATDYCFCRKQLNDESFSHSLARDSLCGVKCRMHGLDGSTPLFSYLMDRQYVVHR